MLFVLLSVFLKGFPKHNKTKQNNGSSWFVFTGNSPIKKTGLAFFLLQTAKKFDKGKVSLLNFYLHGMRKLVSRHKT